MCMWLCCAFFLAKCGKGFTLTMVEQYFTLKMVAGKSHWALQVRKCGFLCQHGVQVR